MTTIKMETVSRQMFLTHIHKNFRHHLTRWAAHTGTLLRQRMAAFTPYLAKRPWSYCLLVGLKARPITTSPLDLNLADPALAHEFYHGRFALAGRIVRAGAVSPWVIEPPSPGWEEALHDFGWLRHMKSAKTAIASAYARTIVDDWIMMVNTQLNHRAWEGHIAARRLISWLSHADMLLDGANADFQRKFLKTVSFHVRYVRTAHFLISKAQMGRLDSAMALCLAALVLETSPIPLRKAETWLKAALESHILPDGGHISRNPAALVPILADLIALCHCYQQSSHDVPDIFITMRGKIDQALRFFLHRDQSLANFNGVDPLLPERLTGLLNIHATTACPPAQAPCSGYQRLAHGATTVLVDTGCPSEKQHKNWLRHAHAGCLSFEMSSGAHRFIVNCGIDSNGSEAVRTMGRLTAAHSTATLNDTSSARFRLNRHGMRILHGGPDKVRIKQIERPDCSGFIAYHNGYGRAFNLLHQRSMALSRDGNLLQGSDRFVKIAPISATKAQQTGSLLATVRFHLHPQVEVSHLDKRTLRLEVMRADVWILTCQAEMYLEESIYFCDRQGPTKTHQIVFSFVPAEMDEIYWAFEREVRKQTYRERM